MNLSDEFTTASSAFAIISKHSWELTRVGVSDLVDFVRIQPDLLFAAFHHRGCEPLLQFEGTKTKEKWDD